MSFPQIVQVAIGLVLVYYLLGAIVSLVTQVISESLETRGVALEQYLKKIAGDKTVDLTNLPQLRALRPIRYANWWNVIGAGTAEKKLEKVPVETLVDAFFDLSGLTARGSLSADELTSLLGKLPESEAKQAMLGWVRQGVTAVSELRSRTSDYFGGLLSQASLTFKAKARSFVIISSVVITLAFGTDSIQLAKDLWVDAGLRGLAAQQAQVAAAPTATAPEINALIEQLGAISFRVGWWRAEAVPLPTSPLDWLRFVALKLAGLGITAAAVSQGSSFWYDLLRKMTGAPSNAPATSSGGSGAVG
jgi:hypothetical protein